MKLVIILICLGFERYLGIGANLQRFSWFNSYVAWLKSVIKIEFLWQGWFAIAMPILPLFIVLSVIYAIAAAWVFGLAGILISAFVLLYCLGPDDLYHQLQQYFQALEDDKKTEAKHLQKAIIAGSVPREQAKANRAVTKAIFTRANESLFAILFWFIVFGPLGALFYRTLSLVGQNSQEKDVQKNVTLIQSILDWIPARIIAICYTLTGNFQSSFRCWLNHALAGLASSQILLSDCGLLALGSAPEDVACATIEENREAIDMVDRVLIVILFIIAALTLATWIS